MKIKGRPISKKNSRTYTGRGFTIASKRYREWENDALWQLKKYKEKYSKKIAVYITFQMKGKLDTDLDNMVTSVLDVLQKAEIIEDDKNVISIMAIKLHGFKEWETIIEIKEINTY